MIWVSARSAPDLCRTSSRMSRKQNGWKHRETSFPCVTNPLLLENIVTGDGTWCYQFDLESKRQSMTWWFTDLPATTKTCLQKPKSKHYWSPSLTRKVSSIWNFFSKLNHYCCILLGTFESISTSYPAGSARVALGWKMDDAPQQYPCTQCDTCVPIVGSEDGNYAWSPSVLHWPSSCGLFPVSHLEAAIKWARSVEVNPIKDRVTAVLRSIPQEVFADCFPKLYVRWQNVYCSEWWLLWKAKKKIC